MCLVGSRVLRMRNGDGKNKSVVVLGLISNNVLAGRGRAAWRLVQPTHCHPKKLDFYLSSCFLSSSGWKLRTCSSAAGALLEFPRAETLGRYLPFHF